MVVAVMTVGRHVLIIVENLPVPFDTRVWQEALALKSHGYEVSVICPRGATQYRQRFQIVSGVRILRHDLPLEARGSAGYLLEYTSAVYWQFRLAVRLYRRHPFQVIQACNPPDLIFIVASYFKRKHGVKFVFDHHDLSPELYFAKYGRHDLLYRLMLYLERRTFSLADFSIATNQSYRRVAIERGGMSRDRVVVVRSGPSLERIYPVKPNPIWKRTRRYMAAYVGVIGKQEGLGYLLEAAHLIRSKHGFDDLQFIIVGSGPDLTRVQALAGFLGVADIVEFTGRISDDDLREVLSTSDICINPDEYNEMNDKSTMNKIMEYMAVGKPIVQFDLHEGRFSAGACSLYCKRNDAADLAEKILQLVWNPAERERMGNLGRQRVMRELLWDRQVPRYLSVYDRVAEPDSRMETRS